MQSLEETASDRASGRSFRRSADRARRDGPPTAVGHMTRPATSHAGRVLLYDHGGHNFTYELACDLAERGINISYAFTEGVTAPRGRLAPQDRLTVLPLGRGRAFERYDLRKRVVAEVRLGLDAMRTARREGCRHVVTCNMPVITVALLATYCSVTHRQFTVWFQDSQAGIAAAKVQHSLALRAIRTLEGWGLRRADQVIAISQAMAEEAERMRVRPARLAILPNWAPVRKIPVVDKVNPWSVEFGLEQRFVFLYSGTLGLKHSPERLTSLAEWIMKRGIDAVMLVVSEGPVAERLRAEATLRGLPLTVLQFQPAEVLPALLATADVCVVLLEELASEFSVPSKVWSYMCAARPILGSIPWSNEAARIVSTDAGCGSVVDPSAPADVFIEHAELLWADSALRAELGRRARAFAEQRFSAELTTLRFAAIAGLDPLITAGPLRPGGSSET